jgi:hypothetical protein
LLTLRRAAPRRAPSGSPPPAPRRPLPRRRSRRLAPGAAARRP